MPDLEDDLRADGAAWRAQVDGVRPELAPRHAPSRRRSHAVLGGLVAAALVLGLTVVVLALRRTDSTDAHRIAGADRAAPTRTASSSPYHVNTLPYVTHVPRQAVCPTGAGRAYGSGFHFLLDRSKGASTIAAAAAKYPPKNVQWTVAAHNAQSALLLYRSHFLHVVRVPGGGWAVDSGGDCGGVDAILAK